MPKVRLTPAVKDIAVAFGRFIRKRRVEKGFTQAEAARKAEIDQTQWSKIERGRRFLYNPRELLNISKVLNISLIEILKRGAGELYDED